MNQHTFLPQQTSFRWFMAALSCCALLLLGCKRESDLKRVTLDWTTYNPSSLVLKHFGWLEETLKPQGIDVKWVQSTGSNRAVEYLNGTNPLNELTGESVEFGSTAGLASVLARAQGVPIKAVYLYSRPEWTALVVKRHSPIRTVADLRGKRIAATRGTDPYFFLLQTLEKFNIQLSEVEILEMQHEEGRSALNELRVDAWAGLDPYMAASELQEGNRLLYRNTLFNTYGFLNVRESFAKSHPEVVWRVIEGYERARRWLLENPEKAVTLLSEESGQPVEVIRLQLQRNDFSSPAIGREQIEAMRVAAPILLRGELVQPGTDFDSVIDDLMESKFSDSLIDK